MGTQSQSNQIHNERMTNCDAKISTASKQAYMYNHAPLKSFKKIQFFLCNAHSTHGCNFNSAEPTIRFILLPLPPKTTKKMFSGQPTRPIGKCNNLIDNLHM